MKVKCIRIDPIHVGKLTVGNTYVVLAENEACFKVRNDLNRRRHHDKKCFEILDEDQ